MDESFGVVEVFGSEVRYIPLLLSPNGEVDPLYVELLSFGFPLFGGSSCLRWGMKAYILVSLFHGASCGVDVGTLLLFVLGV